MEFKNKKVLITGASPDFGLTLSVYFAEQGAELFLLAQTRDETDATETLLRQVAPSAVVQSFVADLCHEEQIKNVADQINAVTDSLDIVFHNASLWLPGSTCDADDSTISDVIASTLTGTAVLTRNIMPLLLRSGSPDIVNLIAKCALANDRHETSSEVFSAAKHGHAAFADRLRAKYKGSGLRVISVYPPNFYNPYYLNKEDWNQCRNGGEGQLPTARNVLDAIVFALRQDRICCIDDIVLSNTQTDYL